MSDSRDRSVLEAWIAANPYDYHWFVMHAKMFALRHQRFSVKQLAEGYRWERFSSGDLAGYKWNNTYTAVLARRLMEDVPECAPYIKTRRARCDREVAA